MTTVQIRDLSPDVVATLMARAAAEHLSLNAYLKARLEEFAAQPNMDDILRRLSSRPRRTMTVSAAELLREVRGE